MQHNSMLSILFNCIDMGREGCCCLCACCLCAHQRANSAWLGVIGFLRKQPIEFARWAVLFRAERLGSSTYRRTLCM